MKENYQIILNKTIDEIQKRTVPSLLSTGYLCALFQASCREYLSEYFDT